MLTYLPDLQWCHVAPLERRVFESSKGASAGRPKWMLVSEERGGEIDVGAGRCVVMEAREMKKTKRMPTRRSGTSSGRLQDSK